MHIIVITKFSFIYQIIKEVDFFQLKRSFNPFNCTELQTEHYEYLLSGTVLVLEEDLTGKLSRMVALSFLLYLHARLVSLPESCGRAIGRPAPAPRSAAMQRDDEQVT